MTSLIVLSLIRRSSEQEIDGLAMAAKVYEVGMKSFQKGLRTYTYLDRSNYMSYVCHLALIRDKNREKAAILISHDGREPEEGNLSQKRHFGQLYYLS